MILEALASFNKWWYDVFVVNAGYWFLVSISILIITSLLKVKVRVKTKTREQILREDFHKKLDEWKKHNKDFDIPK